MKKPGKALAMSGRKAGREAHMTAIVDSRLVQIPTGCSAQDISVVVARSDRDVRRRQERMISLI